MRSGVSITTVTRGDVPADLEQPVAVRRVIAVAPQMPRCVVAPLIPAARSRRTMAR